MPAPTVFQKKVATIAQGEHTRFHLLRENQEPLSAQIKKYWLDLGLAFPGVETPWSAAFVSWCVKNAGATAAQFAFSPQHSVFVFRAIKNAAANTGVFHGRKVDAYAPKVGDILHNNRSGNHFDFEHARTHSSYASHTAIVMEVGSDSTGNYLRTVGGNEGDSVGMKEVRLNAAGLVKNSTGLYISVIETLL